MATAEQLKSLIRSHFDKDAERFNTLALQVAASEAKKGHRGLAHEIRKLIDNAKSKPLKIITLNRDLEDLFLTSESPFRLSDLIVQDSLQEGIQRILREYRQQDKLKKHGLKNRRKILLTGPSGTGKTMTAAVLSSELHLPLHTILMDKLVTKFMGETSAKLRQIFDIIQSRKGVYLFDEFDAIGADRSMDNDVGEMRRVLNSFLQFIERDTSNGLIIAATNNRQILDQALFRRFDDILHYQLPESGQAKRLIKNRLGRFIGRFSVDKAAQLAKTLSHAEITQACDDAIKETILADQKKVTAKQLQQMLNNRKAVYQQDGENSLWQNKSDIPTSS